MNQRCVHSLELSRLGIQPSILEYMDQWTIDCLQKYVGTEVFAGIEPSPTLLIELMVNLKFLIAKDTFWILG